MHYNQWLHGINLTHTFKSETLLESILQPLSHTHTLIRCSPRQHPPLQHTNTQTHTHTGFQRNLQACAGDCYNSWIFIKLITTQVGKQVIFPIEQERVHMYMLGRERLTHTHPDYTGYKQASQLISAKYRCKRGHARRGDSLIPHAEVDEDTHGETPNTDVPSCNLDCNAGRQSYGSLVQLPVLEIVYGSPRCAQWRFTQLKNKWWIKCHHLIPLCAEHRARSSSPLWILLGGLNSPLGGDIFHKLVGFQKKKKKSVEFLSRRTDSPLLWVSFASSPGGSARPAWRLDHDRKWGHISAAVCLIILPWGLASPRKREQVSASSLTPPSLRAWESAQSAWPLTRCVRLGLQ